MRFRHIFPLFGALALFAASPALAERPLLQEGKRTVFERVISHPNAKLYADASATQALSSPRTFTSFYVYGAEGNMLRVGVSASKSDGWLKLDETTRWPSAVTMQFTDQMGRKPVLFFRDHNAILDLCSSDALPQTVEQYVTLFSSPNSRKPSDLPVIAAEPTGEQGQVSQKNFYLLPVLDVDNQLFETHGTKLINVACIDPGIQKEPQKKKTPKKPVRTSDGMTTGIVFVIDTTKSMKPYIDETRGIVRQVYDRLQTSVAKDKVAIAVVAFRSDVKKRPATKYNTLLVSDFATVNDRDSLEQMLSLVEECRASTHAFDEDSLSGVKEAVDKLSWDKVDSKAILMVSDAGPLMGRDSETGMDAETMADYLRTNDIFLTALHVKSPAGRKDHAYAEKCYKELSKLSNGRSSYIAIDAPTIAKGAENFKEVTNIVANIYCNIAERQFQKGKMEAPKIEPDDRPLSAAEQAKRVSEAIGYAMHLQFVGDHEETTAPQVVSAWISDSDLTNLVQQEGMAPVPAAEPAVLLTKLQLSQLRKQVQEVIASIEEAFLTGQQVDLYDQLISAVAKISVDPTGFSHEPDESLIKKGVLLEVLDGLPYRSALLNYTHEDWMAMPQGELVKMISRLKSLVRRYEEYDRDNTHWEGFGSSNTNEWVYRVPISVLP